MTVCLVSNLKALFYKITLQSKKKKDEGRKQPRKAHRHAGESVNAGIICRVFGMFACRAMMSDGLTGLPDETVNRQISFTAIWQKRIVYS